MDGAFLAQLPLFQGLPRAELDRLAATMRILDLAGDAVLFCEGDPGDSFYIVLEGQVNVFQAVSGEDRLLAVRGAGELIGEMSLLNRDGLRTASVRAKETAKLWEMPHAQLDELIRSQPQLAYDLTRMLSARLTDSMQRTIEDLQSKNVELARAYQELEAAQAQIIEKEKLERELQLAHDIQMSILPQSLPQVNGYDFGARMVPARAVGGDFYDLIPLDEQNVGVVVGDVVGKGVPAALYMAQTHALIHVAADLYSTPGGVLRRVNRQLVTMGAPGQWVTVLYGVLDTASGRFGYARAGHELPLIGVTEGQVWVAPLDAGQPLGLFEEPAIDERVVSIPPGGSLLLSSDGFVDAQNPQGEGFGRERLLRSFAQLVAQPAQKVCDSLWHVLEEYQGCCDQFDDVTLFSVRSGISKS